MQVPDLRGIENKLAVSDSPTITLPREQVRDLVRVLRSYEEHVQSSRRSGRYESHGEAQQPTERFG